MSECLSFLLPDSDINQKWLNWTKSLLLFFRRLQSWSQSLSSQEVNLFHGVSQGRIPVLAGNGLLQKCGIYVVKQQKHCKPVSRSSSRGRHLGFDIKTSNAMSTEGLREDCRPFGIPLHMKNNYEGSNNASLYTKRGMKGINQDSMLLWENFTSSGDAVLCGVFDGHGSHGHFVSRTIRHMLPLKLASSWETLHAQHIELEKEKLSSPVSDRNPLIEGNVSGDPYLISLWEEAFHNAYKAMDRELLINDEIDSVNSGTTALCLVKQGSDLIIANVGDSRAVLGVLSDDNSLLALQLTTDLTPDVPKEAERIRCRKGRIFSLPNEPKVKRVWLPHKNFPGLAMSRCLGDFCLKSFGVIAVPEVTHRQLTKAEKFVVLATDGIWDVLSNEEVVQIVGSISARSDAAKAVVDKAVDMWKVKYPFAKVDDCAVICLFLDSNSESPSEFCSSSLQHRPEEAV